MVASLPTPTLTPNSTPVQTKKPTKSKLKMESAAFEELFLPTAAHAGTLDPQILLDEWLANDLQETGFLSEGDCSHVGSPATDLGAVSLFGSPALGDTSSISSTPITSPILDNMMNLFPELANFTVPTPVIIPTALSADSSSVPSASAPIYAQVPRVVPVGAVPLAAKPKAPKRAASTDVSADINIKRQRNTDAARRSRLKKVMRMEALEQRVADLEADNAKLVLRAAVLESEKAGLATREKDYESRIVRLEAQLADAHKALTKGVVSS